MLGRKNYAQEEIDAARALVEEAFELGQEAARKAPEKQSVQESQK